jgi:hypothetical protein
MVTVTVTIVVDDTIVVVVNDSGVAHDAMATVPHGVINPSTVLICQVAGMRIPDSSLRTSKGG